MRRTESFDAVIARGLRDLRVAKEYVLVVQETGLDARGSLAKLARAYGIKEFSEDYGVSRISVFRMMKGTGNYYLTVEKILGKLDLVLGVAPKKKRVASIKLLKKAA